jgi:hypothetical protein
MTCSRSRDFAAPALFYAYFPAQFQNSLSETDPQYNVAILPPSSTDEGSPEGEPSVGRAYGRRGSSGCLRGTALESPIRPLGFCLVLPRILIHRSAWRDCLETSRRGRIVRFAVARGARIGALSSRSAVSWDPVGEHIRSFQTVSGRLILGSRYTDACINVLLGHSSNCTRSPTSRTERSAWHRIHVLLRMSLRCHAGANSLPSELDLGIGRHA